jgi:hypothetical protein
VAAEEDLEQQETSGRHLRLRSLSPEYVKAHRSIYLRHLEYAVDDKNRDVALTDRYRAGNSSVLDAFEEK